MMQNPSLFNFFIVYLLIGLCCGFAVFLYQMIVKKRWIAQYKESLDLYLKDPSSKPHLLQFLNENPPSKATRSFEEHLTIAGFWPVFLLIGFLWGIIWLGDVIKNFYRKTFSFDKQIYDATMDLKQQNLVFMATHPDPAIRKIVEAEDKGFDGGKFIDEIIYKDQNEKMQAQIAQVRSVTQKLYGGKIARGKTK